jgi:protein phosphatase 2C family protein 2/3
MLRAFSRISTRSSALKQKEDVGATKESHKSSPAANEDHSNANSDIVLNFSAKSRKGRNHANEDRVTILKDMAGLSGLSEISEPTERRGSEFDFQLCDVSYLAAFDGHGGEACADWMSRNLHRHIAKCIEDAHYETFYDIKFCLADAFKAADEEFCAMNHRETSGSCGVVALIYGFDVIVAHVGDCRAVLHYDSKTIQLTKDHRPSDDEELRRILANGGTVSDGRIGGVLSPSRAFGDMDVRVELGEGIVISEPDVMLISLPKDELFNFSSSSILTESNRPPGFAFLLLGTDGIFDELSNEDACAIVDTTLRRTQMDASKALDKLIKLAAKFSQDDVTAAVAVWSCKDQGTPTARGLSKRYPNNVISGDDDYARRSSSGV